MTSDCDNGDNGDNGDKCDRCGIEVQDTERETLLFESQYKQTLLALCPACFKSAREVFNEWNDTGTR